MTQRERNIRAAIAWGLFDVGDAIERLAHKVCDEVPTVASASNQWFAAARAWAAGPASVRPLGSSPGVPDDGNRGASVRRRAVARPGPVRASGGLPVVVQEPPAGRHPERARALGLASRPSSLADSSSRGASCLCEIEAIAKACQVPVTFLFDD